jgi:pilus assembly protein Flp/PilA
MKLFRRIKSDQKGATAVEYGLIVALIILALMAGLSGLGGGTSGMWTNVAGKVKVVTGT